MADKAKCGQCGGVFAKSSMYVSTATGGFYCKGWDACDDRTMRRARKFEKPIVTVAKAVTSNVHDPVLEQNC